MTRAGVPRSDEAVQAHDGGVEIRRGHALELVADLSTYDLLVTDPPYAFGGDGAEHAMSAAVATVLRESAHKLRKGGWAVVFAASSWRSTYYMIEAVRGVLEPVRFGTWVKPASRSKVRTPGWAWASVNVIVMRRPGKNPPGAPVPTLDWICEPPIMDGRRAQLPPSVAEWAVAPFAELGGLAFDPFAGSGALLVAAANAGMRALGFELEGSDAGYVPPSEEDVA
jgi:DNA modification methylase